MQVCMLVRLGWDDMRFYPNYRHIKSMVVNFHYQDNRDSHIQQVGLSTLNLVPIWHWFLNDLYQPDQITQQISVPHFVSRLYA